MKVKGFGIKQNGVQLYLGCIRAGELVDRFKVDVFHQVENPDGYQRECVETRARYFGRFIAAGNYSPSTVLVNLRGAEVKEKDGILVLPEDIDLWIVDGQHRVAGLKEAIDLADVYKDLEIPVLIMNTKDKYEEAKQFVVINRTQKGVRQDLAERFLQKAIIREGIDALAKARDKGIMRTVLHGFEWKTTALEVVDILNKTTDSPWYQRIFLPNEAKGIATVSQKSFTDSLEPVLKKFEGKRSEEIASLLNNYWSAIRELCPEPFDIPDDYQIQRTHGVFALHDVLSAIVEHCGVDSAGRRVLTKEGFIDVIKHLGVGVTPGYWHSEGTVGVRGTGKKSFKITAIELKGFLEKNLQGAKGSGWVV